MRAALGLKARARRDAARARRKAARQAALAAAAKALRLTPAKRDARLAALGGQAEPPWRKERKEAAAAALVALGAKR